MEGFFVVLGLALLMLPVLAIVAIVRTVSLRQALTTLADEQASAARDLRIDVAILKRTLGETQAELARVKAAASQQHAATSPVTPVAAAGPATNQPAAAAVPPGAIPPVAAKSATADVQPSPSARPAAIPVTPVIAASHAVQPVLAAKEAGPLPEAAHAGVPVTPPPSIAAPVQAPPMPPPVATQSAPRPPAATTFLPPSRVQPPPGAAATEPQRPTLWSWLGRNLPLEAVLGMNLFAKIGIVLLVLGFALLGRMALVAMGPGGKVALLYAIGGAMLGAGIWLERKERYRLIGRTGIGGGWALLFFTTYAMQHVAAMQVMHSATLNCVLLLAVAVAIVVHTLRYESQLVTGLAFLLGFSTVALTQDTVYALSAGVILALGIVFVALKKRWYELEVFGILASFGNHLYWLVRLYPEGVAGHAFPQFLPSAGILLLYWLVFRVSYVVRKVDSAREERSSTVAALLNTTLLLAVMKFQSTRPELAFYALAGLGLVEFALGQLPLTRRRRAAFSLLTVLGTLLIFAAVPFKYSGNSIALVWMIAAEALLIAGIMQHEVLFRRLGLIAGVVTGGLVAFESRSLIELRLQSDALLTASGVELLVCAALFYANALWVRARWRDLFAGLDDTLATVQSYLGAAMAFLGVWAVLAGDWTALGWAGLLVLTAVGIRRLRDRHLSVQAAAFAFAVALRTAVSNLHLGVAYPAHSVPRLIALPLVAAAFYLTAALVADETPLRRAVQSFTLLAGTAALMMLALLDLAPAWVALGWLGMALALAAAGRRLRLADLCWQEHALVIALIVRVALVNLSAASALDCYLPSLLVAAALYGISRWCTLGGAAHRRPIAWMHTWSATGLLAALAWYRADHPWLAVVWAAFALALALLDRLLDLEELPLQTHVLGVMTLAQVMAANLWLEPSWHGYSLRAITLVLVASMFYALTGTVRMPARQRAPGLNHLYSAAAGVMIAWVLWQQLLPMAVAEGLAVFAAALFACGQWLRVRPLRQEAYVLLAVAFGRLFAYNLMTSAPAWHGVSQRVLTVVPVAAISLGMWAWLQHSRAGEGEAESGWAGGLMAWLSTASIAGLFYVELDPAWIVLAWAAMAVLALAASLLLRQTLFLRQAALLLVVTALQAVGDNIYGTHAASVAFWRGPFTTLALACLVLIGSLPLALRLKARCQAQPLSDLERLLRLDRIEQWIFFVPVTLAALGIFEYMAPGRITLAWGIEGLSAVLLGLAVAQRSFRLTGIVLLLLCVAKVVFHDAWQLSERDRYITFIALGAALMLVSVLYNRYRESVLKLL